MMVYFDTAPGRDPVQPIDLPNPGYRIIVPDLPLIRTNRTSAEDDFKIPTITYRSFHATAKTNAGMLYTEEVNG